MWRDPLVHFVIAGTVIFSVYALMDKRESIEASSLEAARDEVLVREAVARGLTRDDARVRQRLIVGMQRALVDPIDPPTDEQLVDFYSSHRSMFAEFTRDQVFEAWVVAQGQTQLDGKVHELMQKYDVTIR